MVECSFTMYIAINDKCAYVKHFSESLLATSEESIIFWGTWRSSKNWLEPIIKPNSFKSLTHSVLSLLISAFQRLGRIILHWAVSSNIPERKGTKVWSSMGEITRAKWLNWVNEFCFSCQTNKENRFKTVLKSKVEVQLNEKLMLIS